MRLVHFILACCFLTASCDIILVADIGGEVRIAYLLLLFICAAAMVRVMQDARILWPRGSTCLGLWLLSQLIFLPMSGKISFGLRFFALLLFTIVSYFAVIQLYGNSEKLPSLVRIYLISFIAVALFGLLQFATPLVGLPGIFVTQWITHNKVARINGFNYEPSYYATYMIIGWIMLIELQVSKARITEGRLWKWATVLVTVSLFLSTSKTAWLFMMVELVARLLPSVWRSVRSTVVQATQGRMLVPLPKPVLLLQIALFVVIAIGAGSYLLKFINPLVLLNGSGIANTPAHSYNTRRDSAYQTFEAFLDAPLIGRSLGGVPVYIASRNGVEVQSMDDVRLYWGFPIALDVLVASGIFGAIPFFLFVYANTFGALRTARRYWPSERAKWLRAFARAMIFECMLLMGDQNMLRVYVWIHLSMVALVAYNLEFGVDPGPVAVASETRPGLLLEALPTA